jgi:hypothetical protein
MSAKLPKSTRSRRIKSIDSDTFETNDGEGENLVSEYKGNNFKAVTEYYVRCRPLKQRPERSLLF